MSINNYLLAIGLLPSLILPQLAADSVALAKQDDMDANLSESFVELVPVNEVLIEDDVPSQNSDYLEQPIYVSIDDFRRNKSNILVLESIIITGYSSTPDQTDSSPFVTASGSRVRDGIIATNFLSFGTKVKFPQLFGDKVFVVEDRMAKRNSHKIDIWFADRHSALQFGVKRADVLVVL